MVDSNAAATAIPQSSARVAMPPCTKIMTPMTPMARPDAEIFVIRLRSHTAEIIAPNIGEDEFRTESSDAVRVFAANAIRKNGSAELKHPNIK